MKKECLSLFVIFGIFVLLTNVCIANAADCINSDEIKCSYKNDCTGKEQTIICEKSVITCPKTLNEALLNKKCIKEKCECSRNAVICRTEDGKIVSETSCGECKICSDEELVVDSCPVDSSVLTQPSNKIKPRCVAVAEGTPCDGAEISQLDISNFRPTSQFCTGKKDCQSCEKFLKNLDAINKEREYTCQDDGEKMSCKPKPNEPQCENNINQNIPCKMKQNCNENIEPNKLNDDMKKLSDQIKDLNEPESFEKKCDLYYQLMQNSFAYSMIGGTDANSISMDKIISELKYCSAIMKKDWKNYDQYDPNSKPPSLDLSEIYNREFNILMMQEQLSERAGDMISATNSLITALDIQYADKTKIYLALSNLALQSPLYGLKPVSSKWYDRIPDDLSKINLALEYGKRAKDNAYNSRGDAMFNLMKTRQIAIKVKVLQMMYSTFSKGLQEILQGPGGLLPPSKPEDTAWNTIISYLDAGNNWVGQGTGELVCPVSSLNNKITNAKIQTTRIGNLQGGILGLIKILESGTDLNEFQALSEDKQLELLSKLSGKKRMPQNYQIYYILCEELLIYLIHKN